MQLAEPENPARPGASRGPLVIAATCWLAGCVATSRLPVAEPPLHPPTTTRSQEYVPSAPGRLLTELEARSARLNEGARWIEARYERDIEPLTEILTRPGFRTDADEELRVRIALALQREARATGISAELLASVLAVENPWLDLDRRSPVGAVGLMQVMPFHAGTLGCPSADLEDLDANICHGARVFARYLQRSQGDVRRALLRYNGCVRGNNTPDCRSYPMKVYAQAEGASP